MTKYPLFALLVGILLGCAQNASTSSPPLPSARVSEIRYVMGTLLEMTLYAPSHEQGREILNDAFRVAESLDSELSLWKPESPITVFNRDGSTAPRPVSSDIYTLVTLSKDLSEKTDGAFTIGVRPLVEMWEAASKRGEIPSQSEIDRIRGLISPTNLITAPPSSLGKSAPGVKIETGGIGKGYAVDSIVKLLRSRGVTNAFINFGRSSMAAIGSPPNARGWKVTVALTEGSSEAAVELRDETLSVSRAHGTPYIVKGVAYAHIFDPTSGMPVQKTRGAAIRGPSATEGEAFVKYLVIRGAPSARVAKRWSGAEWMVRTGDSIESSAGFGR